jgi:uncharacterized protein YukE
MAFEGMDVDAVGTIYHQMTSLCQQLESVVTSMPGLVSNLEGAWKGPDAQQFAAQWPSHQAQLQNALTGLQEIVAHTQANLAQQEQTSSNYA